MRKPRGGRLLMMAKAMPRRPKPGHRRPGAFGQDLVRGHQRAVDVRDDGRDLGRWRSADRAHDDFPSAGERAPAPAVARQQRVGLARPGAAGRIDRQRRRAILRPGVEHRLHHAPAGLDVVGALEQRRIADHAVIDQRLVAGARRGLEIVLVVELHLDAADLHARSRDLGAEAQGHALVGLDVQDQIVRRQALDRRVAEQRERRLLELDGDLGAPLGKRLAGAQIERHAGPAPIVDHQLHRDVGFGRGVRARRRARADTASIALPSTVPAPYCAAHDVAPRVLVAEAVHGVEHLGLLGAHRVGGEAARRLHRDRA